MSDSSACGQGPQLYVVPPAPPPPVPVPCRDTPRLPMRAGIGPRRRVHTWHGGPVLAVHLQCGHRLYGEIARRAPTSMRCPLCAGCGPELYVVRGRRRWEVRRRSVGAAQVLELFPFAHWARRWANERGAYVPMTWDTASERARRAPRVDIHVR